MTDTTPRGCGERRLHHPESNSEGHDGRRRHHGGGHADGGQRRGTGRGRRHGPPAGSSDQPIGTTSEALAEAFLGVTQLLRRRARFQRQGPRSVRSEGLTFARAAMLGTLDSDGPQRMGQLAHRLGVVPRTVTPMVDALERDGLVVREADPDDRRATVLLITDAGLAELTRTRTDRRSAMDDVFDTLGEDERTLLAAVLTKLRAAARAGLDEAGGGPGPRASSEDNTDDAPPGGRPTRRGPSRNSPGGRDHHRRVHASRGSWGGRRAEWPG